MSKFENKLVIITGAGSGIGRETAKEFARRARESSSAHQQGRCQRDRRHHHRRWRRGYSYAVDVSSIEQMEQFAADVYEEHGCATVLVNNAGYTTAGRSSTTAPRTGTRSWRQLLGRRARQQALRAPDDRRRSAWPHPHVTSPAAVTPIPLSTP